MTDSEEWRIIAVDPGAEHIGCSAWVDLECTGSRTYHGPEGRQQFFGNLIFWLRNEALDEVVVEDFRLYASKAKEQIGSQLQTIRVIGVIEQLCLWAEVPYIEQEASIKKATYAIARRRGVTWKGPDVHAKDSEVHGYYRQTKGRENG